jgi:tetratricopeptide (TPR) repeat protein
MALIPFTMKTLLALAVVLLVHPLVAQTFEELLTKGDEYYDAGNYPEAVSYFTKAIEKNSKDVRGWWYRADAYRLNKEYSAASHDYTKALEMEPDNVKFLLRRGNCYYNQNQYQQAFADYDKALKFEPENATLWLYRGDCYYYQGQYKEAMSDYNKGLEFDPSDATLWLYRGDCYSKLNDAAKACEDYKKAHELGHKNARNQSVTVGCDWATNLADNPCPAGEPAITRVEVDEFTGAVIVSKGLRYMDFDMKKEEGDTHITGNEFALNETIIFKITKPSGFCADTNDEIFIGTGFSLYDEAGKLLGEIPNIYKQDQSVQLSVLKTLSATMDFQSPLEAGKKYSVTIRYYDARGKGEVLVYFPFHIATRTLTVSNTFRSTDVLGPGITAASVDIEPAAIEFNHKGSRNAMKSMMFDKNSNYAFTLTAKTKPAASNVMLRLVDQTGNIVSEQTARPVITGTKAKAEFNTLNVNSGPHQLWIRLYDPNSFQMVGVVIPVEIR